MEWGAAAKAEATWAAATRVEAMAVGGGVVTPAVVAMATGRLEVEAMGVEARLAAGEGMEMEVGDAGTALERRAAMWVAEAAAVVMVGAG